jgi:hypothetical protein
MARPLTNTEMDGALYVRPPGVDAQIDFAVRLSLGDLRVRLLITDRNDPGHLRSECLVHLGRCESNLLVKVPDGGMPGAASLRQEILDDLTDLFVMDGSGDFPDELDFYECRFNMAFRALRIDAVRRDVRRRKKSIKVVDIPPLEVKSMPDPFEDAFAKVSEAFKNGMSIESPSCGQLRPFRPTSARPSCSSMSSATK